MRIESLLPAADEIVVESMRIEPARLEVRLRARANGATCPCCGILSSAVHSRYERAIRDLPWRGTPMRLRFTVRKFFCRTGSCPRQIFAEQLPMLAGRKARTTPRFDQALVHVGLECGGDPGSRLGTRLGIAASGDTILRRLRAVACGGPSASEAIGVDDFAFRRGLSYGTIIVDHHSGRPVDLLPDREAETLRLWLAARPAPSFVTRDRSAGYGSAITAAAPQAVQIADRWHLLANARQALIRVLDRHHRVITATARCIQNELIVRHSGAAVEAGEALLPRSERMASEEALVLARRDRRLALYDRIIGLRRAGRTLKSIGVEVGVSKNTVARFVRAGSFPELAKAERKRSIHAFADSAHAIWTAGERNAVLIWQGLQAQGYAGSLFSVRRHVARWRTQEERSHVTGPRTDGPRPHLVRPGSNRLSWLLLRPQIARLPEEERLIADVLFESPAIQSSTSLLKDFCRLVTAKDMNGLASWVTTASCAGVETDVRSFAGGIGRDWSEVSAALQFGYSNGRAEGHVNRLKLIKRKMYGRAKFDLLRIRVLASGP